MHFSDACIHEGMLEIAVFYCLELLIIFSLHPTKTSSEGYSLAKHCGI